MPDFSEFRYAPLEFRETEEGLGVIEGTVIRYGDVATFPWGTEEIKAGAFGKLEGVDLYANRMHNRDEPIGNTLNGRLKITDSPTAMRAELTLPNNSAGRDVAYEVADGELRGLSIEMRVGKDVFQGSHRIVETARTRGFGVVDQGAYPQSDVLKREFEEYLEVRMAETASGLAVPEFRMSDVPEWAWGNCHWDRKGRMIFAGGDLDCRYEDFEVEERQMPRLRGRLPYNTDGIVSMARNEHVRFLPGAFGDLGGEILALVGGDYDNPLAGTAQGGLRFVDADDALNFNTSRVLETAPNRDFITKLRGGYVQGITAGWALQGSDTIVTPIEGGGKLITVRKAMLCELRFNTRSSFAGASVSASPRRREAIRFQVA